MFNKLRLVRGFKNLDLLVNQFLKAHGFDWSGKKLPVPNSVDAMGHRFSDLGRTVLGRESPDCEDGEEDELC